MKDKWFKGLPVKVRREINAQINSYICGLRKALNDYYSKLNAPAGGKRGRTR
jgi:hypothetical protein